MLSGLLMAFVFLFSVGCGEKAATDKPADGVGLGATPDSKPKPGDALIAGQWCYDFKNETLHLTAVMEYDGNSEVIGTLYGDVQDKAEGYFTTYTTNFDGTRDGETLKVKTKTEIEGDVQEEDQTWTWDGKTLDNGRQLMKQVDCEPAPAGE
jgi:hypothetical protein